MALILNGITIPEDVANALTVNGADITDVFHNGVQVWDQILFQRLWSGDSFSGTINGVGIGIDTSGSLFRKVSGAFVTAGAWVDVDIDGNFSGDSYDSVGRGFDTSANQIRSRDGSSYGAWATFLPSAGFSGGGIAGLMGFVTSGGLCASYYNGAYGPYISLT